jgi:hypothetical protein
MHILCTFFVYLRNIVSFIIAYTAVLSSAAEMEVSLETRVPSLEADSELFAAGCFFDRDFSRIVLMGYKIASGK